MNQCRIEYLYKFPICQPGIYDKTRRYQLLTQKTNSEFVSGITSLSKDKATPDILLQDNRLHWFIEDRLHYVRDFTYDEDRSQIRIKNGPQMMACIRNFVISIFNILGLNKIASA